MKLAVSNIAWPPDQRLAAYDALQARGITGLEIAPGLFFHGADDVFAPDDTLAQARLAEMAEAGLGLVSMQSLLFGVDGAALFEGDAALVRLVQGIERAIDLSGRFGIANLVFGSPKQRIIPDGMDPEQANDHAAAVFRSLGDRAAAAGTTIAIEANPTAYGTNFLTHADAVVDFVRSVDHPAVRMILDVGAMHLNDVFDETPGLIARSAPLLSHVHISEPYLNPAPASSEAAAPVLAALQEASYAKWISIEMKATATDSVGQMVAAVDRLRTATQISRARP
jgi:sugar phosphate isomerase/epimerase